MKHIFISRNIDSNSKFNQLSLNGYQLTAQSLIQFEAWGFKFEVGAYDWLFFYSINGIKYFFDQIKDIDDTTKLAVMGPSSAAYLEDLTQKKADFIFSQAECPIEEANILFSNLNIAFVQSTHSLKSVEKEIISTNKIVAIEVYSNTPSTEKVKIPADILVFTSPLNVEYYNAQHPIKNAEKCFAIGATTAAKIKEVTGLDASYPLTPIEDELYKLVNEYLSIN